MKIQIIAAMDLNDVIGINGKMPWEKIPEDLKRFKKITDNQNIVVGRKTLESIGGLLPGRTNYILTRDKNYKIPNVLYKCEKETKAYILDFNEVSEFIRTSEDERVFIIGGGEVYRLFIKQANELYLTIIYRQVQYNKKDEIIFFPNVDWENWKKVNHEFHDIFSFENYVRIENG